jgi:thiol-disulfide isomerase/thioredoxin
MRRHSLYILLALTLVGLSVATAPATEQVIPAADFDLTAYRGRVVVLDFWAGWCKPCREALPWFSQLQAEHGERGLVVVAVNIDRPEAVPQDLVAALHEDVVVVLDPTFAFSRPYRLQGLPTTLLIDRQGRVRNRQTGFDPAQKVAWLRMLETLLAEGPPEEPPED